MPELEVEAIMPKRPIVDAGRMAQALEAEMYVFVQGLRNQFEKYPPQMPTKSGYIRTGTLGRSWFAKTKRTTDTIEGRVASTPAAFGQAYYQRSKKTGKRGRARRGKGSYATYVMGVKQTSEMKRRQWKKAGDVLKKEWPGQVKRFGRCFEAGR